MHGVQVVGTGGQREWVVIMMVMMMMTKVRAAKATCKDSRSRGNR